MSLAILTSTESGASSLTDINANFALLGGGVKTIYVFNNSSYATTVTLGTDVRPLAAAATETFQYTGDSFSIVYDNLISGDTTITSSVGLDYFIYLKDGGIPGLIAADAGIEPPTDAGGTVTSVSVVTANGVSGSVATATTTPAITLTLGAITPTTTNGLTLAAATNGFTIAGGTTSKTLTVPLDASVSGTNTGDNATNTQYSSLVTNATHTGDATGSGALTVVALNGTNLAALGTGILKNTTTTGVPFVSKVVLTEPANSATLTILDGKTLTTNHTLTLAGTDGTTMTFPSTSASVARIDSAQSFTGLQSFATLDTNNGGLYVEDIGGTYKLQFYVNETNTATRTLYIKVNNANRNLDLSGDLTVSSAATISGTNTGDNVAASTSVAGLAPQATAPAAGLYNYVGITNGETAYTNKALFDATVPSTQAFGDSAASGSAAVAARRDHKHAMMAAPTTEGTAVLSTGEAGGTKFLREDGDGTCSWQTAGGGDMILASVQTVTGLKTFDTTKLAVKGSSTGSTAFASANASANDYTQTIQAKTGTIANQDDVTYIGTTSVALNRTSAALTLAGITLTTPDIGTPSAGVLTNCSGTAASLTAGLATGLVQKMVRLTSSGSQSIGTTLAALAFDTETFDTDTMHAAGDNTKITFTTAGTYLITGAVTTDANVATQAGVRVDGSTYIAKISTGNAAASIANGANIALIYTFTANQYIELMGYFGSTQNTKSGVDGCFFSAIRLAA